MDRYVIETKGITKKYRENPALRNVDFRLKKGTIHSIVGENGAGKTTLAKIITGLEKQTSGYVYLDGEVINLPFEALKQKGIGIVFQEVNLIPALTALENIFLGEKHEGPLGVFKPVRVKDQLEIVRQLMEILGFDIDPMEKVSDLDIASQKMVEIIKIIHSDARVIVLDEVTGFLNDPEIEQFYKMLKKLTNLGLSIVYISHKLADVVSLSDEITILRNGEVVETLDKSQFNIDEIVTSMSSSTFINRYPRIKLNPGPEILRVENLSDRNLVHNISFSLKRGEILGISGLAGSGRTALAEIIAGIRKKTAGEIYINKKHITGGQYWSVLNKKVAYASELADMQLIDHFNVSENITLQRLSGVMENGIINSRAETSIAHEYERMLGYDNVNVRLKADELSSGTQSKVLISKLLYTNAKILILNNITKSLDVVARMNMYNIMNEIALEKIGVILISSNIDELIGMCGRVLVLFKGKIVNEVKGRDLTEQNIISSAMGL